MKYLGWHVRAKDERGWKQDWVFEGSLEGAIEYFLLLFKDKPFEIRDNHSNTVYVSKSADALYNGGQMRLF